MRIVLIIVLLGLSLQGIAQKKVIHGGEACYLHVVEKGNTLYGIGKEYAAPIPKILEVNPEARFGLSIDQKIYIPLGIINRKAAKRSPELSGNVLLHKVSKGETLYSLSKKYSIGINRILESNPGLEAEGLKKGSIVRISTSDVEAANHLVEPARTDSLLHHNVILGETLYSISKSYVVSIDSIKQANGGLEGGLRAGMTLRIPRFRDGFVSSVPKIEGESSNDEEPITPLSVKPNTFLKMGLLLPFSLGAPDTTSHVIPRDSEDIMRMTDIAYEFYRGVQLGLEELSNEGLSAEVTVVDVSGDAKNVKRLIQGKGLEDMDFIIGPLHKKAFELLSADGQLSEVFRTSPLSSNLDITSSKDDKVSKLKASDATMIKHVVRDIRTNFSEANVVVLTSSVKSWHKEFIKVWDTKDSINLESSQKVKNLAWDKYAGTKLLESLSATSPNVVVFPTEHRPAITDLISNLATFDFRKLDITLYGLEPWQTYNNLDADVLERVRLRIPSARFIDWNDGNTVSFIQSFESKYNTIPSSAAYAMVGYDLINFYVEGLMVYGSSFLSHQEKFSREGISTGFAMVQTENGGWINEFCYILEYSEYEFHKVE